MQLPLTNNPEENFSVTISEVVYNFRQLWSEYGFWTLDISDSEGIVLVYGVKLVTKEYLLQQYPHIIFDLLSDADSDPARYTLDSFALEVSLKDV